MQRMGLSAAQFRLYCQGLARTHERRVVVQVLNLEGRLLGTLSQAVIGGQVTVDATQQPTYKATVDLFDPNGTLAFEPEVTDLSVHMSRMLRIIDRRFIPRLGFWVGCTVFTGPLSKPPKRDGAIVTLEADDKSVLAMGQARGERVFPKGTDVKRVLSEMLRDTGEVDAFISIGPGMGKLGNKRVVARFDQRWLKARKLAKSRNRQLFYNGAGVAIARRMPSKVQWTVPPAAVLSPARLDREAGDVKNVFRVVGGKPKGKNKKRIVSSDYPLPKTHPDNPARLGRNGTPRYLYETEENDDIKRKSVADSIARRMRDDAMKRSVSIDVDIAPMPHIEPYDLIRVVADNGAYQIRALQFSLPLSDGVMSLGTKRVVSGRARGASNRGGGKTGAGGKSGKGRDFKIGAFPR